MEAFNDIFEDCTSLGTKIPKDEYLIKGKHIVVDQGQNDIAGYTDMENGLFEDVPAIIFGDHTRIIKYVDEPFFLGADGVKLLKAKRKDANYKYLYYALRNAKIPDTGYNRHFKWLKEVNIEYPNQDKQQEIVEILDRISKVIEERNLELQHLDELIKARFVEMFGEETGNSRTVDEVCESVTGGGTPSMQHPEFYGGEIPFIKSGDVKSEKISSGALWLTKKALISGKAKIVKRGSVIVVVRSAALLHEFHIAVTDNDVVINQDLKALSPKENILPEFLMWSIKIQEQKLLDKVQTMLTSHIRMEDLLGLNVHEASLDMQEIFVEFVKQVDKSKVAVQKSLDETQKLFDSLMQEYFG